MHFINYLIAAQQNQVQHKKNLCLFKHLRAPNACGLCYFVFSMRVKVTHFMSFKSYVAHHGISENSTFCCISLRLLSCMAILLVAHCRCCSKNTKKVELSIYMRPRYNWKFRYNHEMHTGCDLFHYKLVKLTFLLFSVLGGYIKSSTFIIKGTETEFDRIPNYMVSQSAIYFVLIGLYVGTNLSPLALNANPSFDRLRPKANSN